jgi:hypothetical protein
LNIPLGFKFVGKDSNNNLVVSWSGPYMSGQNTAEIKIPTPPSPFVTYNTMYVAVYPNQPPEINISNSNFPSSDQVFATKELNPPINVITPSLNSRITVENPGIQKYLQVGEIWICNDKKENIITDKPDTYTRILSSCNGDYPFDGDLIGLGPQKAFDGDPFTYFYGGVNAALIDTGAYLRAELSSFVDTYNSEQYISSIEVYGGPDFNLDGMQLRIDNQAEAGMIDGLFYSTINLTASRIQKFYFA